MSRRTYVGRFAPSPTGPLHAGSLLAAVASYLDARANNGRWLLRIEDVDELRTVEGAASDIQFALEAHGLHWDAQTQHQSATERQERYRHALQQLCDKQALFDCTCSRKALRAIGPVYPGTCRARLTTADAIHSVKDVQPERAIRFNTSKVASTIHYTDRILGEQSQSVEALGDFIVRRRDGLFAYQLAVVIDDHDQGITDIVRGADILPSTGWQKLLQQALELPSPSYAHFPVLSTANGKLSKQSGARSVLDMPLDGAKNQADWCRDNILEALKALGQGLPEHGSQMNCGELLEASTSLWRIENVPKQRELIL